VDGLYAALGVEPDALLIIRALDVLDWGRTLRFTGAGGGVTFSITFGDCRDIEWRVFAHNAPSTATEIADFATGRDNHRSPAHLLTDSFGVKVVYGTLAIRQEMGDGEPVQQS
jgi:hypothetical protein